MKDSLDTLSCLIAIVIVGAIIFWIAFPPENGHKPHERSDNEGSDPE